MTKIIGFLTCAVFLSLLAAPACDEEIKAGDLVITQAWCRATPGGAKTGGGYLTVENKGTAPDRLIGGSSDVAGHYSNWNRQAYLPSSVCSKGRERYYYGPRVQTQSPSPT